MPRLLQQRIRPESIEELLAAARCRFVEGETLFQTMRLTGAIYLWGYSAEMTIKAAFFRNIGFGPRRRIERRDLRLIEQEARIQQIALLNLHDVENLTTTLIEMRRGLGQPLPSGLEIEFRRRGQRIARIWRETLRYHSNTAYRFEAEDMKEGVEWFLQNEPRL